MIDDCVLFFTAKIMANYANRSSKHDAKGKWKVGASGPPPAPVPVPVPVPISSTGMVTSAALSVGAATSASGTIPAAKSLLSAAGTEVVPTQPKCRCLTKQSMLRSKLLNMLTLQEKRIFAWAFSPRKSRKALAKDIFPTAFRQPRG
jgi:hypothetical protein